MVNKTAVLNEIVAYATASSQDIEGERRALFALYEEAETWLWEAYNGEIIGATVEDINAMRTEAIALLRAYASMGGQLSADRYMQNVLGG